MKAIFTLLWTLFCFSRVIAQDRDEQTINLLEEGKNDTYLRYVNKSGSTELSAELQIIPDESVNHTFTDRVTKNGNSMQLVDHGQRFSPCFSDLYSRLSCIKVYYDNRQVVPSSFPSNQIYNFRLAGNYGSFTAWNPQELHLGRKDVHGAYFSPNRQNDALMTTLVEFANAEHEHPPFLFSSIVIFKTGKWYIFPPSFKAYGDSNNTNTTVIEPKCADLPMTDRKICYEYSERKEPSIKLIMEVIPDNEKNHRIEKKMEQGREVVLIDGEPRMYDPASPILWKLSAAKVWWDGKEVQLKNFPDNHFFNWSISGSQDSNFIQWEKIHGKPSQAQAIKLIDENTKENRMSNGLISLRLDENARCNGIGIYPSTDRNALCVALVRRDEKSGIVCHAALVIQRDGQCDVFPKDFDSFVNDKGQNVTALEGYSDRALKRPPPFIPVPKPSPAVQQNQ